MKQQEVTRLESGQVITHHASEDCSAAEGLSYCPMHRPQPGPWFGWPRFWNSDRQIVVRECPCGVMHPAHEVYDWSMDRGQAWKLVHDCCKVHTCTNRLVTPAMAKANAEAYQIGLWAMVSDVLADEVANIIAPDTKADDRLALVQEALDLVVKLWPSQGEVKMSKETWDRLRRVLLAVPELVTELEATNE